MSLLGLLGAGFLVATAGIPPNPGRQTPPPGLEDRARKVSEQAPAFELPAASGGSVALAQALKGGPVAVVFYRGFW